MYTSEIKEEKVKEKAPQQQVTQDHEDKNKPCPTLKTDADKKETSHNGGLLDGLSKIKEKKKEMKKVKKDKKRDMKKANKKAKKKEKKEKKKEMEKSDKSKKVRKRSQEVNN